MSYPSLVRMLTVRPDEPAVPAKRTSPPAAATTGEPTPPAMSIPRCCPLAYGSFPFRYGVITSPRRGQVQDASAGGATARTASTENEIVRARWRMRRPYGANAGGPRGRQASWCEPLQIRESA